MPNLVELIQEIAKNTNESGSPTSVLFGTVISTSPLKILVEQKLELTEEFLILTKNVKDYTVNVTVEWDTENKNLNDNQTITNTVDGSINVSIEQKNINLTHKHSISGTKSITIHNALVTGDKVILIQQQGGQKFVVLDKV